ncbi:YbhB/YbcL family Raf kinase inhibitor-like protein [Sphingomonas bacterium]|uniref:YbhB/YbcL family Raf kinase inhibitor-like protein n=1 Tax=Sphingomonas bacterium TaxID=1895847 RepID=UPI003F68B241
MLEHVPAWLGGLLRNVRAGHAKLLAADPDLGAFDATLSLTSPAFASEARMPPRFTGDGEGVSPPLVWSAPPEGTACFALVVEDPDAPLPRPIAHAVVWGLPADARQLAEGAIGRDGAGAPDGRDVGRNSFFGEGWLPPDPPRGHGSHDYVFQLFALSEQPGSARAPAARRWPRRSRARCWRWGCSSAPIRARRKRPSARSARRAPPDGSGLDAASRSRQQPYA